MTIDEFYIKRCIHIGKNGLGTTRPNPMVGCVIVVDGKIISEGYTSKYGGSHAEVNAIKTIKDKTILKNATLYVTLEPCSHFGKTPPCSDLIITSGIPKVVVGCLDDNVQVSGRGIKRMIEAGIDVTVGVLEEECKTHLKRFFTFHNKKRPYIILKWAETKDGYIAPKSKQKQAPVWITNAYSRQLVHKWRSEEQAILVGRNTVGEDNPSLTVRSWTGTNPIRVVIDSTKNLTKDLNIFDKAAETIIVSNESIQFDKPFASQICNILLEANINSVIIEGGAKTLQTFIDENLWDEARIFVGNTVFNDGLKAPKISGKFISESAIQKDILKIYSNDKHFNF